MAPCEVLLRARAPDDASFVAFAVRCAPATPARKLAKAFRKAFAAKYGRGCAVTAPRRNQTPACLFDGFSLGAS